VSELPLEGVLLDVDDTLVDTRAAFTAAMEAVWRAYLPDVPAERVPEMVAMWASDAGGHYRAYTRGELGFDEQRRLRADELHRAFGGPPVDDALYPQWLDVFWGTFERSWRAHEDARETVDALVAAGLPVGVVSNAGRAVQERKLAAVGLADVPVLVTLDTFGFGKPDARVFLEGARLLGTGSARTAYVGDELDVDALGAAGAGLVGIWLDRPGRRRGGDHLEDPEAATRAGVPRIESLRGLSVLAQVTHAGSTAAPPRR
jgi:putative hydrolase of the HAD superfamily